MNFDVVAPRGDSHVRGLCRRDFPGNVRVGDAINVPHHHVMLFAGWANQQKTRFCAIEEYATGHPAEITLRELSSVKAIGYTPIRRDAD